MSEINILLEKKECGDIGKVKRCCRCHQIKTINNFFIRRRFEYHNSYQSYCKECSTEIKRNDRSKMSEANHLNFPQITNKKCPQCKIIKKSDNFTICLTNKNGISSKCSKCQSENRYKIKENNPIIPILNKLRSRSKLRNYDFNLTEDDIKIPAKCPVLGIPLFFTKGSQSPNTPSVDRIDNNKGYTKDNIIVVSWRANKLKHDATIKELEQLYKFYRKINDTSRNN